MPKCPASASQGFSSTPLKITQEKDLHTSRDLDDGVLSDDEDTFSLLSPIYHDSFDSAEEDLPHSPVQQTSPRQNRQNVNIDADVHPASPTLSAWEMWLVNKAKEDRLKLEKKAEEERLLKQKREQQEREQMQKKIIVDEKIQEWLKMKNEQHKQFVKQSKEEELIQKQREKQREIEQKAQQKYNDWLQKKNREKIEKEKKIKEEAVLKQEQEKERHKRAEEKFKDWLTKANEKSRASPKSPCYPTSKVISVIWKLLYIHFSLTDNFYGFSYSLLPQNVFHVHFRSQEPANKTPTLLLDSEILSVQDICCRGDDTSH
uniref:Coiled-coil domain-containing protein n=1 Tax=Anabas testudineus TaxID=64144 RepID=A0A7N6A1X6_ANATE